MIRWLRFLPEAVDAAGRRIAMVSFEARSTIAPERLCALGAEARDRLSQSLGIGFAMDVFDVGVPSAAGWERLRANAWCFPIAGAHPPACIVIQRRDAYRLIAAAFAESEGASTNEQLSPIERVVLARMAHAVATAFAPLYGGAYGILPDDAGPGLPACSAFIQVRLGPPIAASIGIALADEPQAEICGRLPSHVIGEIAVPCAVEMPLAELSGASVAGLAVGSFVAFDTKVGQRAALKVGGQSFASGECGSLGSASAFLVRAMIGVTS